MESSCPGGSSAVVRRGISYCHSLILFGDFVADVSTTNCASNSCQCFTFAATHLIAQQSTNYCAHTYSNGTVLSNRWRSRL